MEALKSLAEMTKATGQVTSKKSLDAVKNFTDRLKPYFDALNSVATGSNFASLIYGALRFVLQVQCHLQRVPGDDLSNIHFIS